MLPRWDLRPATGQARPGSGGIKQRGSNDFVVTPASTESWSSYDDGNGNTYYVNNVTGESVWELPRPGAELHQADNWGHTTKLTAGTIPAANSSAAAGAQETGVWWEDGTEGFVGETGGWTNDRNPFGEYTWPAAQAEGAAGEKYVEGSRVVEAASAAGWTVATQQEEGVAEGWTQEWDEESQNYYWYNGLTGESRW